MSAKFPNVNLHEWVGKNRSEILSAIHSCYAHWIDKNCPPGPTPFTSFPRWAEVGGGVMNCCGLTDPCRPPEGEDLLGGDLKQGAMKALYELLYEDRREQWIQKAEIYDAIRSHQAHDERLAWFGALDDPEKGAERRIGKALISFQNRIFAGVRLVIDRSNQKTQQWRFRFTKAV